MKKALSVMLAAVLLLSVLAVIPIQGGLTLRSAAAATGSAGSTNNTLLSDNTNLIKVGIRGSYFANIRAALDRINAIRYEACKEGVPNPSNPSKKLKLSDYHALKWSSGLEKTARQRAAEAIYSLSHTRPNGQSCFSIDSPDVNSYSEVLAWNWEQSLVTGINQFYDEKSDWVRQTGGMTGHYESLIDPYYNYVGLGGFWSQTGGAFPACVCGRFSTGPAGIDQTFGKPTGTIDVAVEIPRADVKKLWLKSKTSADNFRPGASLTYELWGRTADSVNQFVMLEDLKWSSSNASVAAVSAKGVVTAKKGGVTTIKARTADGQAATTKLAVYFPAPTVTKLDNTLQGVRLSWKKVSGAEKYRVFVKSGSTWKKLGDTASTAFTHTAARSGVSYTYTVRTITADGKTYTSSFKGAGWTKKFIGAPVISKLTNTKRGVRIAWGKVAGAAKYRVFVRSGSSWKRIADTTSTALVDIRAKNGVTYLYTVRCISSNGKSFTGAFYTAGKKIVCRR